MINKVFSLLAVSVLLISACVQTIQKIPVKETKSSKIIGEKEKINEKEEVMKYNTEENSYITSDESIRNWYVIINTAYLGKPGYVVVQKDNNGAPGEIIGKSEIIFGNISNLNIPINEEVEARAFAVLYYDNGDSVFDIKSDSAIDSKDAIIPLFKMGMGISEHGKIQSTENFQMLHGSFTVLDIFSIDERDTKDIAIAKIRIEGIEKTNLNRPNVSEGDILNVFLPYGTEEEMVCVGSRTGPCRLPFSFKKGDKIKASISINLADSSYRRMVLD